MRVVNSRFRFVYNSLIPRPTIVVFGFGTRVHVRMRTKLENGVLRNGQQPQSVVNGFYRFEAMKMLSDWEAEHSFRAKSKVSA